MIVLNGAPAPNPGRCFALFISLPAAPTAQAKVRGQQNRAILHNTHDLCKMALVLLGRECSIWGCRPKPHNSLRSLVATRCFKSLGLRYAPVVFLRATQKRCILNARPARRCIPAAVVLRALF